MREFRSYGSVRGAPSHARPYRDCDADMAQHRSGELGEEAFDEIEPRAALGGRGEFEATGWLIRQATPEVTRRSVVLNVHRQLMRHQEIKNLVKGLRCVRCTTIPL